MEPTKKHPAIEELITRLSPVGLSRQEALNKELCAWCGKEVGKFRDSLSRTEYQISGFCQKCQDETFGR